MKTLENLKIETSDLGKWPKMSLIVGVVGLIITAIILALFWRSENPSGLYLRSYLVGFIFWFNMGAGCLFWLMVHHLTGGAWGIMIRRVLETGARMIVWSLLFIIPILFGMHQIYEWTHTEVVKLDPVLSQKAPYLNETGFFIRLGLYAIIWAFLAYRLTGISIRQDKVVDPQTTLSMKRISGAGLVVFFLTMTFAAIDWLLSLEPHFFSTMYGPVVMTGQALGSMAFVVSVMVLLVRFSPMRERFNSGHVHDLGNFLLASTMFWAYVNFSQFLIIWSANLAEEVPYYLRRMTGGWGWIAAGLIAFHFFAPFLLLLNRGIKKNLNVLVKVALFIIFLRFLDLCYLILPSAHPQPTYEGHLDILSILVAAIATIGIGGIWLFFFFRLLVKRPLLPINEPYLQEALDFRGGH